MRPPAPTWPEDAKKSHRKNFARVPPFIMLSKAPSCGQSPAPSSEAQTSKLRKKKHFQVYIYICICYIPHISYRLLSRHPLLKKKTTATCRSLCRASSSILSSIHRHGTWAGTAGGEKQKTKERGEAAGGNAQRNDGSSKPKTELGTCTRRETDAGKWLREKPAGAKMHQGKKGPR